MADMRGLLMKVGELGVLQNLDEDLTHLNGLVAEIRSEHQPGNLLEITLPSGQVARFRPDRFCFCIRAIDGTYLLITPDKIRPLDDPDAQDWHEEEDKQITLEA